MKTIYIVFPDPHLSFSPTTLNLFYHLKTTNKVKLLTLEPNPDYSLQKIQDPDIIYLDDNGSKLTFWFKVVRKVWVTFFDLGITKNKKWHLINGRAQAIIYYIKKNKISEVIAVDFFSLWCAQQAGATANFVSLEISENDLYRDNCDLRLIKSVLIQDKQRYNHLFKKREYPTFFVQNAPRYLNFSPCIEKRAKNNLIFCGSAVAGFGIFTCLDFLKDYPQYTLTIKGAVPPTTKQAIKSFYNDLLLESRLVINEIYMTAEELTLFVSTFRIGFVFYDCYRFEHLRTFNYLTAPSGKMFQYFNSGIPCIGNNLPGLCIIKNDNIGVLIDSLGSFQILDAIEKIENNYEERVTSARKTAKEYDFETSIIPFSNYLKD